MSSKRKKKVLGWATMPEYYELPSGWKQRPFSELALVIAGQSPPSSTYNERGEGLPFLQGNADFGDKYPEATSWTSSPQKVAIPGDSLISVRAPVGELNRADKEYAIGRGLAAVRGIDCNPDFLHHALIHWRQSLQRVAQGTTFDAVTARHFGQLHVACPPLAEQEAIARVLNAADVAIEHSRAAVKQAIQVDRGVLADLLSRGIHESGSVRNTDDYITTSVGKLPTAWNLRRVGDEFDLQNGFTLNENRKPVHRKRRYLRVANVHRDTLRLADVSELEAKDQEFALRELQVDDLLVVEGHADRMQIGRCARVTPEAAGMTFQNHLFRLRTRGHVSPYFGAIWLNSTYAQRYWNGQCATSSGLNTINQRMLKTMLIPVPSLHEQERIVQVMQGVRAALASLKSKLAAQEALKAALLRDLLTGRVRVGAATLATTAV